MYPTLLASILEALKGATTRAELIVYSILAAVLIAASLVLGGCGSNQLPSISVDVVPAGGKTAPAPAQIVVVPGPAVQSVPQK